MVGVGYAAVAAVFVLGALFLILRVRRSVAPSNSPAAPSDVPAAPSDGPTGSAQAETARHQHGRADHEPRDRADVGALRRPAEAEADAIRRAARAEALTTTADARAEAQAATAEARTLRTDAEATAAGIVSAARATAARQADEAGAQVRRTRDELSSRTRELDVIEAELREQRRSLAVDVDALERDTADLAARTDAAGAAEAGLATRATHLDERESTIARELERVAGLSTDEARAELLAGVEVTARREAAVLVRTIENEARTEGTDRARAIVVEAVERVASEQTSESVVSVFHLPTDEMKGRIIGREGRNIRSYEATTGVNLIIDDTPEAVLLSCFDPVRREVGRLTLQRLVQDGRIHPHRIEEAYEQSRDEVDALCLRAANDAIADVGIGHLDPRLLPVLGRLKYRTSYGQNVLGHLIETAHIAGIMAAELGIEPTLVKRCAFLHDIGKALTHEVEGSHAIIGADLLRRYGEDEAVAHAVEAHHNEVQPRTVEAVLTQASDTCSAARPGARRESLESYVKRLARIEEIATAHAGVEKVFAMQAGREVRVMVQPGEVDDLAAQVVAREIAKQIEDELTYPGQIRVTVVRESRSTEIAH